MLWWAEGTKKRKDHRWKNLWIYTVEVTNTDPRVLSAFVKFLREDLKIDESKLRAQIQIHKGDDLETAEMFWSERLDIPRDRFNKTIMRPTGNKAGKNLGTCKIRYNSKELYLKL